MRKALFVMCFILSLWGWERSKYSFGSNEMLRGLFSSYYTVPLPPFQTKRKKDETLLCFISSSIPIKTLEQIVHDANEIGIKTYFIWRGFSKEMVAVLQRLAKKNRYQAKIHPLLFRDLNITHVPVYVLAKCPTPFRSNGCDYLFRMDGDVALRFFLQKINEHNVSFHSQSKAAR